LSDFDVSILKMEQDEKNLVYSPLSIKYALKMLEEGAEGESKAQISKLVGEYTPTQYKNNEHMSLANSLWVRDTFKDKIKQSYIDTLDAKYAAELKFDSFKNASNINGWVKNKTLGIIPNILQDNDVEELNFALINALAIDMEWIQKFTQDRGESTYPSTEYEHEAGIDVYDYPGVSKKDFNESNKEYSVMEFTKVVNNYDIIKEIGEEKIKEIVTDDYLKFVGVIDGESVGGGDFTLGGSEIGTQYTKEMAEKELDKYLPKYLEELGKNYHLVGDTTDFGVNYDDDVKVFQKELKKYGNTTLEFIGIMPIKTSLDQYIDSINNEKINNIINNIKTKAKDFEEGVVTRITGFIPKFIFEYSLDLKKGLINLNVKNVFDSEHAELSNISDVEGIFIADAKHKTNIEFTQDGIKAAAATTLTGAGGGSPYNYYFKVPVKEIDLTFNKPYMFIIYDKENKDVWFIGSVYEPLRYDEDTTVASDDF
jgi:serine protease inhibitor